MPGPPSSILGLRTYLEPLSRPDNESVTPPNRPLSLTSCLSRSLSAALASFFAWLVLAFCAASFSASAFLCCARPSSFLASSPVKAPGFFCLACGLLVHSYSPSTAIQATRLLVRGGDRVPDRDAPLGP